MGRLSFEFLLGTFIALVLAALQYSGVTVNPWVSAFLWLGVYGVFLDLLWRSPNIERVWKSAKVVASIVGMVVVSYVWWNTRPVPPRAQLRVNGFEILRPVAGRPIQVNVFFENRTDVRADLRVFHVSAVREYPATAAEHAKLEQELQAGLKKIVEQGRKVDFHVSPGQRGLWYTINGAGVTPEWVQKFADRKQAVFFAGQFVYTDRAGDHSTKFCAYGDGRRGVILLCKTGNDED
jgi:hypothetical protein